MDHDILHRSIIDNGGLIVGGYVREWIANGEPSDNGWSDIDIMAMSSKHGAISTALKDLRVRADFQARAPFNDFFCNCWGFDGKIFPIEAADKRFLPEEIMEQTKNKEAHSMKSNPLFFHKYMKFVVRGWKVFSPKENPIHPAIVQALLKKHESILAWKKRVKSSA